MGFMGSLEWPNYFDKKRCKTLLFRLRAKLKKALKDNGAYSSRKKKQLRFQYDPSSYALNFDDGSCCFSNNFEDETKKKKKTMLIRDEPSVLGFYTQIFYQDACNLEGDLVLPPCSSIRVSFLKLKENLGDKVKNEVLGVIGGIKDKFGQIRQLSYGENFSPARAKGFSIASLAVFPGQAELDAVDSNEDLVNHQKDKVREHLDSVLVLDYVVPPPQARPASL